MGSYNVLICDDEPDIVNALKIYLKNEDYDFFTAGNGKDALRILHDEKIDLVLMDIMMPEMDGIKTLSELRSFSNVPVIFLTAKSEDTDKVLDSTWVPTTMSQSLSMLSSLQPESALRFADTLFSEAHRQVLTLLRSAGCR